MSVMELVKHRRSVRTFDGNGIEPEVIEKLKEYAAGAKNPFDIDIEWFFINAKENNASSPVIVGTDKYITGKVKKVAHAEEAFGYALEDILLYAESLGLGSTWIAGTMTREAFEKAIALGEDEAMPCVSPIGYPAKKMSIRETAMRKGVKADWRMGHDSLFFKGSFDTPIKPDEADSDFNLFELVRWAPSAVNKQPWRIVKIGDTYHFFEKRSRGYVDESGWDIQKIDMGIALFHFAMGVRERGAEPRLIISAPDIALPEDTIYIASYTV